MDIRDYTVPDRWGRDTRDRVVLKVPTILDHMKNRGVVHVNGKDCITGYAYHELYDWDLYFETLFLSYFGVPGFCRSNVELFLDTQHPSGFVARTIMEPRWRHPFKPFLAQTVGGRVRLEGESPLLEVAGVLRGWNGNFPGDDFGILEFCVPKGGWAAAPLQFVEDTRNRYVPLGGSTDTSVAYGGPDARPIRLRVAADSPRRAEGRHARIGRVRFPACDAHG